MNGSVPVVNALCRVQSPKIEMNTNIFEHISCVACFLKAGFGCTAMAQPPQTPDDNHALRTVEYHGIRSFDPRGRDGLRNPERGLRIETLIAEPPGAQTWGPAHHLKDKITSGYRDQWWILDAQRYEPYGLTLAQTYCYLDEFVGKPISAEKLLLLQKSFDNLRKNGLKAVLRFAYEKNMSRTGGPTLQNILEHLEQLTPIIRKNTDVIFVMQAGFVGAWGEWHSSTHGLENDREALAAIITKVLDVLPAGRMTQVRVPKYKRWVLSQPILGGHQIVNAQTAHTNTPAARIGFNNDGFLAGHTCGGTWTEAPHFSNPGNPEFDYMTEESPYVPIDGELFWSDQGGKVDGLRAAIRMRLHHYSSFSLAHSFSEREGKPYSIDDWMKTPLTVEQVRNAKLPISDGYFTDADGNDVPRTQFEYIRDHLGYRLELQRAKFPESVKAEGVLTVKVELINRGFGVIHNPRPVNFVLIGDDDDSVVEFQAKDAAPRTWQPYQPGDAEYKPLGHTFGIQSRLPREIKPGWYQLGLWMPDAHETLRMDARYAIRVANRDVHWWSNTAGSYGANILGVIQITEGND